jgi:sorting nexin-13
MADLVGKHVDMFRKNQSQIGVDVMVTLSSEERDERLKQHLIVSQELHPALLSSEHEYKVRANTLSFVVIHLSNN